MARPRLLRIRRCAVCGGVVPLRRRTDPVTDLLGRWRAELTSRRRDRWDPDVRRGAEQILKTNIEELDAAIKERKALQRAGALIPDAGAV